MSLHTPKQSPRTDLTEAVCLHHQAVEITYFVSVRSEGGLLVVILRPPVS
jgi:hypothetical protein